MVISLQLFSSRYVSELYEAEGQIETRQSLDRLWQAHDCRLLKRADHWALLLTSSYDDWAFVVEVREDDPKREVSWSQGLWNWTSLLHTKRSWIQVETTSVSQSCCWPYRLYPDPFSFFAVVPCLFLGFVFSCLHPHNSLLVLHWSVQSVNPNATAVMLLVQVKWNISEYNWPCFKTLLASRRDWRWLNERCDVLNVWHHFIRTKYNAYAYIYVHIQRHIYIRTIIYIYNDFYI